MVDNVEGGVCFNQITRWNTDTSCPLYTARQNRMSLIDTHSVTVTCILALTSIHNMSPVIMLTQLCDQRRMHETRK